MTFAIVMAVAVTVGFIIAGCTVLRRFLGLIIGISVVGWMTLLCKGIFYNKSDDIVPRSDTGVEVAGDPKTSPKKGRIDSSAKTPGVRSAIASLNEIQKSVFPGWSSLPLERTIDVSIDKGNKKQTTLVYHSLLGCDSFKVIYPKPKGLGSLDHHWKIRSADGDEKVADWSLVRAQGLGVVTGVETYVLGGFNISPAATYPITLLSIPRGGKYKPPDSLVGNWDDADTRWDILQLGFGPRDRNDKFLPQPYEVSAVNDAISVCELPAGTQWEVQAALLTDNDRLATADILRQYDAHIEIGGVSFPWVVSGSNPGIRTIKSTEAPKGGTLKILFPGVHKNPTLKREFKFFVTIMTPPASQP